MTGQQRTIGKTNQPRQALPPTATLDPIAAAKRAQLRYVSDASPGITRHHAKNGFDYRLPDGFSWSDLSSILSVAVATGRAVGLEVTIYNPALDEDGRAGRELTNVLAAALGTSGPQRRAP